MMSKSATRDFCATHGENALFVVVLITVSDRPTAPTAVQRWIYKKGKAL